VLQVVLDELLLVGKKGIIEFLEPVFDLQLNPMLELCRLHAGEPHAVGAVVEMIAHCRSGVFFMLNDRGPKVFV